MAARTANALWEGSIQEGSGRMSLGSGAFEGNYSFQSRFGEEDAGTNPEELIAAAHAGCFSMALSAQLGNAGMTADSIKTRAEVTLEKVEGGFAITAVHLGNALDGLLPWAQRQEIDRLLPSHFTAPSGSHLPIDYAAENGPALEIRVQELFGLDRHPSVAGGKVPLLLILLSPAHRPIQTTRDLPGFWRGSWRDVAKDLKGRYPRHFWPDDPITAAATARAKPRGT